MSVTYESFVASKLSQSLPTGLTEMPTLSPSLSPFQSDLVAWALKRGRGAIFAATGLGKTRMQIEWARHIDGRVLVLAPLAVAQQTVAEARAIGVEACVARDDFGVAETGTVCVVESEGNGRMCTTLPPVLVTILAFVSLPIAYGYTQGWIPPMSLSGLSKLWAWV